jgi:hypothetical protein
MAFSTSKIFSVRSYAKLSLFGSVYLKLEFASTSKENRGQEVDRFRRVDVPFQGYSLSH